MNPMLRLSPWAIIVPTIIIVLFSLIAFLTNAPISMVTNAIKRFDPKIFIQTPTGNMWTGQAYLFHEDEYLGLLSWDLDVLSVLLLTPKTYIHFKKVDLDDRETLVYEASGQVNLINNGLLLSDAYVNVNLDLLLSSLPSQHLRAKGFVTVSEAVFQWSAEPSGRILWHIPTLATAQIQWQGGEIGFEAGGISLTSLLPALAGELRGFGDLNGRITRLGYETPLVTCGFINTGVLFCNVHYGLVNLLNIPNPDNAPPEKVYYREQWDFSKFLLR